MKRILVTVLSLAMLMTFVDSRGAGPRGRCVEGNCTNGVGTKIWPDGKKYQGHWKNGKRHGQGTMTLPSGKVKRGQWRDGRFMG